MKEKREDIYHKVDEFFKNEGQEDKIVIIKLVKFYSHVYVKYKKFELVLKLNLLKIYSSIRKSQFISFLNLHNFLYYSDLYQSLEIFDVLFLRSLKRFRI